jgi:hypothetical protein
MSKWSKWVDIESAKSKTGSFNDFGVYEVRAVNQSNSPIPINRFIGIDPLGILYIGRSGYGGKNSARTIANRIREFLQRQHSGGVTYAKAKLILTRRSPQFSGHHLQVRAVFVAGDEIEAEESKELRKYFDEYGELPPCNSALPGAAGQG